MKCPICGAEAIPGEKRCLECGARLPKLSPFDPEYVRPVKKRKTWLWVLLSVLALCIAIIAAFAALLISYSRTNPEIVEQRPVASTPAEPLPTESITAEVTSEDCFVLVEGTLRFLPEQHDGSPIVVIPETVGGQTVTAIGADAFAGCDTLTTIVLPETVTAIHPRAFAGCGALRGLFLPEGTVMIGPEAFKGCKKLEALHVPSTMESIAPGVFDDCASLSYIFFSDAHDRWTELYTDYITPFTYVICLDGDYQHGISQ